MLAAKAIEVHAGRVRLELHEVRLCFEELPSSAPGNLAFRVTQRLQVEVTRVKALRIFLVNLTSLFNPVAREIAVDDNYDRLVEGSQSLQQFVQVNKRLRVGHPVAILVTMTAVVDVHTVRVALDALLDPAEEDLLGDRLKVQARMLSAQDSLRVARTI